MRYKGEKLLILGGIPHMIDVVETAKSMGIYTIVVDYSPDSPAKAIADKSFNISTADIDAIVKVAKREKINGIFCAFEDFNLWNALELCERLNLPFYATRKQLEITTNKRYFKKVCKQNGIPVVEEYYFDEKMTESDINKIRFPVIIKPVDSYGSKGISICYSRDELKEGYKKAIKYSRKRSVIVERFIESDYGVEMYYTIQNGNITLSAMTDRYVYHQSRNLPPLPIATLFPSKHLNYYCKTIDKNVRKMIKGLDIRNGVISIQALIEEDVFYIYEMAYRLTGEKHYQIVEKQTGLNLLEMMIDLAIKGTAEGYNFAKYDYGYIKYPSCNLSFLLKEGTIKRIEGLEEIENFPEVVSYVLTHKAGDKIKKTGSYSQMFIRINIVANDFENLFAVIEKINNVLRVISEDGEDMILKRFVIPHN